MKDIITSEADENNMDFKFFDFLETLWRADDTMSYPSYMAYPSDIISKDLYTKHDEYRKVYDQLAPALLKALYDYQSGSLALRIEKATFIHGLKKVLKKLTSVSSGYGEAMDIEKKYKKIRDEDIEK